MGQTQRILITGSSDGLGALAAQELIRRGYEVILHARSQARATDALERNPGAAGIIIADLADPQQVLSLADQALEYGLYDAIIHNAGVYQASPATIFQVNVVAPYALTALMPLPERLVYVSSSMHHGATLNHQDFSHVDYSASKLEILMLAKYVAHRYLTCQVNALDPGWVPTKMGGPGAPDSLTEGWASHVMLALGEADAAGVSGGYFYHRQPALYDLRADDAGLQEALVEYLERYTGITLPEA